jgi:hypothetical protein
MAGCKSPAFFKWRLKMAYVFSTATNDTVYADYEPSPPGGPNKIARRLEIKGGANLADSPKTLMTPLGVATKISEEDAAWLASHPSFIRHAAAGFMTLRKGNADPAKVAKDMTAKDGSAPKTAADFTGKVSTGSTDGN